MAPALPAPMPRSLPIPRTARSSSTSTARCRPSWTIRSGRDHSRGVPALLAELAGVFALVAVISGRPTAFACVLDAPPGVELVGLYGSSVRSALPATPGSGLR